MTEAYHRVMREFIAEQRLEQATRRLEASDLFIDRCVARARRLVAEPSGLHFGQPPVPHQVGG